MRAPVRSSRRSMSAMLATLPAPGAHPVTSSSGQRCKADLRCVPAAAARSSGKDEAVAWQRLS